MEADSLCQYLDWDSSFWGYRVARVGANLLDAPSASSIEQWCEGNRIDCLYFLANAEDNTTVMVAERYSFHLVDIRVTCKKQILDDQPTKGMDLRATIRPSKPADIEALRSIARVSFKTTRFYYDPHFPRARCDALYETWIEKSCNGYADAVLVAENQGRVAGFVTCKLASGGKGEIGLVGVSSEWHGQGLGQALVNESLCWFASQGASEVSVVTQGRNASAQRLYQRCGFLTHSVQLWYHKWFSTDAAESEPEVSNGPDTVQ